MFVARNILLGLLSAVAVYASTEIACPGQPCHQVPSCESGVTNSLTISELSSGTAAGKSKASVSMCYTSSGLHIEATASNQVYWPATNAYSACNDGIFNSDVIEFFISGRLQSSTEEQVYCYSEIDTNPANQIFMSGIYNPNLNHTGVQNMLIDCDSSNITHATSVNTAKQQWKLTMDIPFTLIDTPYGCPTTTSSTSSTNKNFLSHEGSLYRGNFYRINELISTTTCSSSKCEYLAWSPTTCSPPAFHEPTKFGYFILV